MNDSTIHVTRRSRRALDAGEMEMAQQGDVNIPLDGAARMDVQEVEVATNNIDFGEKAAQLAFLEEKVEIYLSETNNPNDEQFVYCAVNGIPALPGNPYLSRGQNHIISRKHVEQLARARGVTYTQPFKNETTDRANVMRPNVAMKYPFSVIRDDNPRGADWLRKVMASA